MALGFYFAPQPQMSAAQYDECIARLKKAGVHHPRGRMYHACFSTPNGLQVFDVWSSQAEFEAFGHTLMPILQALGVNVGQPMASTIHNLIVPPAPKAKAAPKPTTRRKAARKPAAKKKARRR